MVNMLRVSIFLLRFSRLNLLLLLLFLPTYLFLIYVGDDLAEIANISVLEARTSKWKECVLKHDGKQKP